MISNLESTETHILETIGRNISDLRHSARLSRTQLAELLGISYQQLYKYERGQNRISAEYIVYLKFYLNAGYDEFFKGLF